MGNSLQVKSFWGRGTMLARELADDMCWGKTGQNLCKTGDISKEITGITCTTKSVAASSLIK
jgi:hypothetical protein